MFYFYLGEVDHDSCSVFVLRSECYGTRGGYISGSQLDSAEEAAHDGHQHVKPKLRRVGVSAAVRDEAKVSWTKNKRAQVRYCIRGG